jgi:WD40 repeat protein
LKLTIYFHLQGVECFDFNKNLNLLVTGSLDHLVRLWNPYVPNKPMSILEGHAVGVIGVKIHEGLVQVFSYSKDAVSNFTQTLYTNVTIFLWSFSFFCATVLHCLEILEIIKLFKVQDLKHVRITSLCNSLEWAIDCCLTPSNHGKNKLHFSEMMIMSDLY